MLKKSKPILRFLPQKESKASYGAQQGGQLGFALPIAILVVVILVVVGGAGYYFCKEKKKSEVKLQEGMKYEYISTFREEEKVLSEIYLTKETDKEWNGIIAAPVEAGIQLLNFKINKDDLNLFIAGPFETEEVLFEKGEVLFKKEKEISLSQLAEEINQEKVWQVMVRGNEVSIIYRDGTRAKSKREAETDFIQSLKNYGAKQEKLGIMGGIGISPKEPTDYKTFKSFKEFIKESYEVPEPAFTYGVAYQLQSLFAPFYIITFFEEPADIGEFIEKGSAKIKEINYFISQPLVHNGFSAYKVTKENDPIFELFISKSKPYLLIEYSFKFWGVSMRSKLEKIEKKTFNLNEYMGPEMCEKVADKDECYKNIAERTKDANLCKKITDSKKKDWCYALNIAAATKDVSLCEEVLSRSIKDSCYGNVARATKDVELCERIIDDSWKNQCYLNIAKEIGDASLCEKITDERVNQSCYREVARATKNAKLCEKLTDSEERGYCFWDAASQEQKDNDAKRAEDLRGFESALEVYYTYYNSYPVLTDTSQDGKFLEALRGIKSPCLDPQHPECFYEYIGYEDSYILKCYCEIKGGAYCDMADGKKDHAFTVSVEKKFTETEKKLTEAEKEKLIEITKNLYLSFSPTIRNLGIGSKGREITITGHAETREDVLKLKEALEKIPEFTDIECPASTWIKPEDIDFTFTAKFKSGF